VDKKPLIGVSICAVVLLVLGSLANVVGYQTVQSSNQKVINDKSNEKELLFQTIVCIANNKDIQRIIFKSHMNSRVFFNPDARFSVFNTPVLTKNQLKKMYFIGLLFSKFISKSKIHLMVEQYQFSNQEMQKEINAVIEKDTILNGEIKQLSNSECDCENEHTTLWSYPVLCMILYPIQLFVIYLALIGLLFYYKGILQKWYFLNLFAILVNIGSTLNCFWYPDLNGGIQ
jgi:hypothetical protein